MKMLSAILFLVTFSGLAKAQEVTLNPCDQNGINQALAAGGTVYLNPGVYEVTGTINIHSNTVLTGSPDAIIRVSSASNQWFTGSNGIISCSESLKNVEISGFQIDGNLCSFPASYANTPGHDKDCERCMILGGYTNDYGNNISIHDMKLYNTFSDGMQLRFIRNVAVYNNFISNCQHEGIFWTCIKNSQIYNNQIAGITSDCTRLYNCVNCKVHDNTLFSYSGSSNNGAYEHGENGLQVGNAGSSHGYDASNKPTVTSNIEVFGNTFADNGLKAILLDSAALASSANVFVHDNKFVGKEQLETMGVSVDVSASNPVTVERSEQVFGSIFDVLGQNFYSQIGVNDSLILPDGVKTIPTEVSGTIEYVMVGQTSYTLVNLPTDGLSVVHYVVNGSTITHTLMIGEVTANGIKFTKTSIWTGAASNNGDSLKLDGKIPVADIRVKCITPRGSFVPTFKLTSIDNQSISVHPAIFFLFGIVIIGIVAGKMILKSIYS